MLRPSVKILTDRLVYALNWVGISIAALYIVFMLVVPWVEGSGSWRYVQNVWDRWQSLNVGMLAFFSSVIALNISRFNANKQREREFSASKAFLPSALSELVSYYKDSASIFKLGWGSEPGSEPDFISPKLPHSYKEVFSNCIRHAEPAVGDYLSQILMKLQVHDSRLRSYIGEENCEYRFHPQRHNVLVYLFRLAELQALVAKLFGFARNLEPFDDKPLDWEDFRNAFGNLDLWLDEFVIDETNNLEAFTKRRIARSGNQDT